jgi:hypothetical protein
VWGGMKVGESFTFFPLDRGSHWGLDDAQRYEILDEGKNVR